MGGVVHELLELCVSTERSMNRPLWFVIGHSQILLALS